MRHALAAGTLGLLLTVPATAGTVQETEVRHDHGRYHIRFTVLLVNDLSQVRGLVNDYRRWPELSSMIESVQPLAGAPEGEALRITYHLCLLFFCRTLIKHQLVQRPANGEVITHLTPHPDNHFSEAREHWRIRAHPQGTEVRYEAVLVPDFFVPPLIGPWLITGKIREEVHETARRLERLSAP